MFYSHDTLDRADRLRKDADAMSALRNQRSTRLLPVNAGRSLVEALPARAGYRLASLAHDADVPGDAEEIFLGLIGDDAWFAVSTRTMDEAEAATLAAQATGPDGKPVEASYIDLRVAGPALGANEGALLAYARGLVYWADTCRFCDRCGRALTGSNGGHVRVCDNPDGAHSHFPRTDPAVIMLVIDDSCDPERCLLGRSPAWPEGVFSTLAGFVEPGETLEQAVQREVHEESGVVADDVRYVASQAWPFPRSIMLGFEARARETAITVDAEELAEAHWFTRDELATFGNWGDDQFARKLPRPDSIARFLINRWMTATPQP